MRISKEQINHISTIIDESGITIQTLRDDLIDHLCCVIESKMELDTPFDQAFEEALREVAPHGLGAIQNQTLFLLNSPNKIFMRKIIFMIGFMSAISVSIGWLFVTLRWPGGVELFNAGFLALLMLFIPMMAFHRYKILRPKVISDKLRIALDIVSSLLTGLSLVFKVLHLQGADVVLILGVLIFTFGFLPFLFLNLYRKSATNVA